MRKINTLSDLRAEKLRLRQKQLLLEEEIKNDFESLKESFSPAQLVADGASKMLVNKNFGLMNQITNIIVDLILKKILLRNSGFLTRLVLPFIAKNTANNYLADHKTKILGWFGDLILKLGDRNNHKPMSDRTTADTNI